LREPSELSQWLCYDDSAINIGVLLLLLLLLLLECLLLLLQALICSSFVPLYSGVLPPKYRGVVSIEPSEVYLD